VGVWGLCERERNNGINGIKCLGDMIGKVTVGGHSQGICLCKGLGILHKRVFFGRM